jgi:hypothetical protein
VFTQFVSHFDKSETTCPYERTKPLEQKKKRENSLLSSLTNPFPFPYPPQKSKELPNAAETKGTKEQTK